MKTNNTVQLRWVKQRELDITRYDSCVEHAENNLVYATSWFLNIMAGEWDVLVYGDYRYVMPVPNRRKWGIAYVYQPVFAQQLGIFPAPPPALRQEFYRALAARFRYVQYQTGDHGEAESAEGFSVRELHTRILSLKNGYTTIAKGYDDYITQNLKKAAQHPVTIATATDPAVFFNLQKVSKEIPVPGESWNRFRKLMEATLPLGTGKLYTARTPQGEILTAAFFLVWQNHAYYMAVCNSSNGRNLRGGFALLDRFISHHAGSNLLFDFEGSSVEGVDRFFAAFGSVKKPYYVLTMNRLPGILRMIKK